MTKCRCSDETGHLRVFSLKVALATLCAGKLMDKLRCESFLWCFFRTVSIFRYLLANLRHRWHYGVDEICRLSQGSAGFTNVHLRRTHLRLYRRGGEELF